MLEIYHLTLTLWGLPVPHFPGVKLAPHNGDLSFGGFSILPCMHDLVYSSFQKTRLAHPLQS